VRSIEKTFTQLESHLQALIEGGSARFFPSMQSTGDLTNRFVIALHQHLRSDTDGNWVVPSNFELHLYPSEAEKISSDPSALDGVSDALHQAGEEAGLTFYHSPQILIVPDENVLQGDMRIFAYHDTEDLPHTMAMEAPLDQDQEEIPINAFLIVDGTQLFTLEQTVINIGRRADNHLVIDDSRISRLHAQIRLIHGQFVIFDLGSTGGTYVNNQPVNEHALRPGDVISLAGIPLVFGQDTNLHGETQKFAWPSD